jgi:O-antigen/teichoic acid export membrane protein
VPYTLTRKLVDMLANQPQLIMQTALPGLSEIKARGDSAQITRVSTALTHAMLFTSGAFAVLILLVNRGFVTWWIGGSHYGGLILTTFLVISMLLRHWNATAIYTIFCFGHERRISMTTLLDGVVTVIGSIFLVRAFGAVGLVLASCLGVCLVSLPGNLAILRRDIGGSLMPLLDSLRGWVWRFGLLATLSTAVALKWTPMSVTTIAAAAFVACVSYVAIMLPFVRSSPLRVHLVQQFAWILARPWRTPARAATSA